MFYCVKHCVKTCVSLFLTHKRFDQTAAKHTNTIFPANHIKSAASSAASCNILTSCFIPQLQESETPNSATADVFPAQLLLLLLMLPLLQHISSKVWLNYLPKSHQKPLPLLTNFQLVPVSLSKYEDSHAKKSELVEKSFSPE